MSCYDEFQLEDYLPKAIEAQDLIRYARIGAVARLQELDAEAAAIRKMFAGLKQGQTTTPETPAPVAGPKPRKRRKKMSPEDRKAVGQRMKAYWAAKKQAQEQPASEMKADASEPAPKPKKTVKKSGAKKRKAGKK